MRKLDIYKRAKRIAHTSQNGFKTKTQCIKECVLYLMKRDLEDLCYDLHMGRISGKEAADELNYIKSKES